MTALRVDLKISNRDGGDVRRHLMLSPPGPRGANELCKLRDPSTVELHALEPDGLGVWLHSAAECYADGAGPRRWGRTILDRRRRQPAGDRARHYVLPVPDRGRRRAGDGCRAG